MILEKALVKYDKNGNYDITLQSDFKEFKTDSEARTYVKNNIEKDIEYYFYETQEDVDNNNHYDVIISNDILK